VGLGVGDGLRLSREEERTLLRRGEAADDREEELECERERDREWDELLPDDAELELVRDEELERDALRLLLDPLLLPLVSLFFFLSLLSFTVLVRLLDLDGAILPIL